MKHDVPMSTNQVVEAFRDGKRLRITIDHLECGHFMDLAVAENVGDAIQAARDAGMYVSIVAAWRHHGEHADGRRIELYCGKDRVSDYEDFLAIAQAYGFSQLNPAKPGLFVVSDQDKTPVDR